MFLNDGDGEDKKSARIAILIEIHCLLYVGSFTNLTADSLFRCQITGGYCL